MAAEPPRFPPPEPHADAPGAVTPSAQWAPPQAPIDSPWASTQRSPEAAQPWSAGRRWALGLGIAAASAGLIAAIVGGSLAVGTLASEWVEEGGLTDPLTPATEDLLVGDPGSPEPLESTECTGACFGPFHLEEAALDDAVFDALGTPQMFEPQGTYGASTGALEHDYLAGIWADEGGGPDECFFTYANVPMAYGIDDVPAEGDSVYFLASYQSASEYSTAYRTIRFFETAADAQEHMSSLHSLIPTCTRYTVGTGIEAWKATVTPMPALDEPPTVAAVGWVERGAYSGRFYGIDLLRGNAVIRATVYTDGAVKEADVRAYAQALADNLASWTPQD